MRWALQLGCLILAGALLGGCGTFMQGGAMNLAYAYMNKGQFDRALGELTAAERYAPPDYALNAEIAFLRAQCLDRLGRWGEALGAYSYAAEKYPDTTQGRQAATRLAQLKESLTPPVQTPPPINARDLYPEIQHVQLDNPSAPRDAVQPQVVHTVAPEYPASTLGTRSMVEVVVAFIVLSDGSVYQPRVVSCPDARLAEPSIRALRQWKFTPGRVNGRPVNTLCVQRFNIYR